jgi:hypothetical protein
MINIDARSTEPDSAPAVAEFIVDSVRQQLARASELDLMEDIDRND